MYYYAYIDDITGFCYDVVESDTLINDPLYIILSGLSDYAEYTKCYKIRKKYVNGEWYDTTDLSTEKRCIKPIYVHDDCLKGSYQNTSGGRNDVVLRAVYEV